MLIAPGMLRESEAASPSTHNSGTSEAYFDLAIKYVRRWHHVMNCTDKTITLGDNICSHVIAALELRTKHPEVYRNEAKDTTYMDAFQLLFDTKDKHTILESIKEMDTEVAEVVEQLVFVWETRDNAFVKKLLEVYGFGRETVQKCLELGLDSLDQVLLNALTIPLTSSQRLGLQHHSDAMQPIPRAEVEEHAKHVQTLLDAPAFEMAIMGSYRRKQPTSQIIEILFVLPQHVVLTGHIEAVMKLLAGMERTRYLVADLNEGEYALAGGWQGLVRLAPDRPVRRLNLYFTPEASKGAAMMWYTGSELFVQGMCMVSAAKGMRLDYDGLFLVEPENDGKGVLPGGMDYRVLSTGLRGDV
ncbi:hypothetical protein MMC10_009380 [Thelotrema lepadinum]|nr:hypothetical protein [Thelotrema lepadinum]